jgi:hypothetical protein
MKKITTILAAASIAMLAAGCGSTNNKPPSGAGPPSVQSFASAAYKYAACIRAHGVPNFPNPQVVNSPGQHGIRQAVPAGVGTSPKFASAQKACKGILPTPENETAAQHSAQQRARAKYLLAFAQCLRAHGVQNFPDPGAQGQLTSTMIHAAGVDLQAPSFLTAAKSCIGATHGAITLAQVEEAIHHANGPEPKGSESNSAGG